MEDMPVRLPNRLCRLASTALVLAAAALTSATNSRAQSRFDLTGPSISVHVQRGNQSLPIAMVPNLQSGDKLTIHADLPKTQSVHLILVVAFLRGSTNPPPESWFTVVKTWDKKFAEGANVEVPAEAQQALIFLAPETGGDFSTLKSAVRGRPGTFVRASQDLNEASFEQQRIERYLQAVRRAHTNSPAELLDHSHKLAATLNLKPNDDCFKKPADQQVVCLSQSGTQLLLDDGHGQTLASVLTSGDSANLIGAVAGTPMVNSTGISYSAYVGTVIDLVRLMSGIHTAHFQYIPAIAFPNAEQLNLRLNTAPSFHDPKSVIVVALPAIQPSVAPPLRLQDPGHISCLLEPRMVLPLEGAPLVFATTFAHDLVLHLNNGATLNGKTDIPLTADAFEGGLIVSDQPDRRPLLPGVAATAPKDQPAIKNTTGPMQITGTLRGMWGFDAFSGVTVPLQQHPGTGWTAAERSPLFTGRTNQFRLRSDGTACTASIDLDQSGSNTNLQWKQGEHPNTLNVSLPLEKANPGNLSLLVRQYGTTAVDKVAVTAYSDRTRLETATAHAGDSFVSITGTGLSSVTTLHYQNVEYRRADNQPANANTLRLQATDNAQPAFKSGDRGTAEATLADGRTLTVPFAVDTARPSVQLLSHTIRLDDNSGLPLNLTSKDDLPLNAQITLALRSLFPARFLRSQKLEIALTDGSLKTTLSLSDGSIVLQDSHTALAFFNPAKAFGPSAFGPVQARAIAEDGTASDWIPLGTLVRTPTIATITCGKPATHEHEDVPAQPCQITGKNLFLLDSVASESGFNTPVDVPLGFAGDTFPVPRPADNRTLYLKLRDESDSINTLTAAAPLVPPTRKPARTTPTEPEPSTTESTTQAPAQVPAQTNATPTNAIQTNAPAGTNTTSRQ